jgi:type II secretory pathway component PulM
MVIALLASGADVETLLNNLAEADFDPATVSVIMRDVKTRDAIAADAGPLKGTLAAGLSTSLTQAGLAVKDAKAYQDGVLSGKVFVAIAAPKAAQSAAVEMLNDYKPQLVRVID